MCACECARARVCVRLCVHACVYGRKRAIHTHIETYIHTYIWALECNYTGNSGPSVTRPSPTGSIVQFFPYVTSRDATQLMSEPPAEITTSTFLIIKSEFSSPLMLAKKERVDRAWVKDRGRVGGFGKSNFPVYPGIAFSVNPGDVERSIGWWKNLIEKKNLALVPSIIVSRWLCDGIIIWLV